MVNKKLNGIQWEDPPGDDHGQVSWVIRLRPLMEYPKRWARISEAARPVTAANRAAYLIRYGRKPPGQWEFVSRTVDGRGVVYGRYLGAEN